MLYLYIPIYCIGPTLLFQKEVVRRYIADQREHHRRFGFEEEYRRLPERNGVPYDERYLWS